ncbi:MAG TPA: M14 family zinc carboxypeptidase, partial [Thermoanaerobaculia bacterium]|nr:M14 family zinc carboxypeptidase [Thermoanaerobaculia bacterium]
MRKGVPALLAALCLVSRAMADDPLFSARGLASRYEPAQMDPRVPTPEKVLGFRIGDRFATHAEVAIYARAVAKAVPERVRVETYGRTPEGRELIAVVVTSPENHARMEDLAAKIRALYTPASGKAMTPPSGLPIFVWFSYGVHGDEASSPDAALATLYHLAASRDAETAELLRRVVLTIDPMVNPDGRMRYLSWLATAVNGEPDPNPDAREHHPAWPRGRTNHFGFDLNRDWAWLTQAETRARIPRYRKTPPQVHVDFHEMSPESSYFFPPTAEPLHAGLQSDAVKWLGVFGRENAAAFDLRGWTYFIRETFDLFYPGYGDSWPFFNGAIGMTYEMAGGPGGGLAYQRRDGSVLTLKERALKHFTTGLATVRTAAAHRDELLRDFAAARAAAFAQPARSYVVPVDQEPYRLRLFVETLRDQGIEVKRSKPAAKEEALVIETSQPSGALAAALLDEKSEIPPKFLEEARTRFLRREDEGFYDVTAWSLPGAFGLRASRAAGGIASKEDAELPPGKVTRSGARLGYLVRSPGLAAFPILARCGEKRIPASIAGTSFRASGENYPVGSLFLRRDGAPPDLDAVAAELALSTGTDFDGVESAWTEEGIALGSERFVPWKPARVGLVTGPGIDRSSAGWALDAFTRVFRYPVSVLDLDAFDDAELSRYDVLVFPNGSKRVIAALGKSNAEAIRAWTKAGGVIVTIGAGGALLREKDVGLSQATEWKSEREKGMEKKPEEKEASSSETKKRPEKPSAADDADLENRRIPIPGAIFRTRVKPEHFLLFGNPDPPRVLLATDAPLVPPPDPFETVVSIEREKPLSSGHAWPEAVDRMAGSPYLIAEPAGKGWAITFVDDPNFRGFWLGTELLFGNAAILAPSFQPE